MADPRERRLTANGIEHHLIEWGADHDGPLIVLCHGFLDLAWGYKRVGERLEAAGMHVVAFDWRGHGESDWIGRGGYYHFPDYILDLHELLPQLTDAPCHLVGHSMGGTICSMFAATHPDSLLSLTLLEGLGPPDMPAHTPPARLVRWLESIDKVRAATPRKMKDAAEALSRMRVMNPDVEEGLGLFLAEKSTEPHPDGSGRRWRFDPMHRTPSAFGFEVARFHSFLEAVSVPSLNVVGSRGMRSGDEKERLSSLKDTRLVELPDTGHMLQWTAAEPLSEHLLEFWRGL
jgi:pimeloyl-ACP methyl ester carboxylesterase